MDKHRMIIPAFAYATAEGPGHGFGTSVAGGGVGVELIIGIAGRPEPEWVEIHDPTAEDRINASVELVFRIPQLGEAEDDGTKVPVALVGFANLVEHHIQMFKAHRIRG